MKTKHIFLVVVIIFFHQSAMADEKNTTFFPHKSHIEEHTCLDCHAMVKKTSEPSMPLAEICSDCHDNSPEERVSRHGQKKIPDHVRFHHKSHEKTDCDICHEIRETRSPNIPEFVFCNRCHTTMGVTAGCRDCHPESFTPGYHQGAWLKTHGIKTGTIPDRITHGKDCGTCHGEPSCTRCHQTMKPKSHSGFFRLRGHGLKAAIENRSCRTCHRESFCIQCHRETKPMNHKGAFRYTHGYAIPGGGVNERGKCSVCHNTSWCASCHTP
ncbi:MAG: hypothetical protein KKD44_03320 [Proteobacteria bacterium]|nr:hypothetical protein [Pseudomonadota bacterium]